MDFDFLKVCSLNEVCKARQEGPKEIITDDIQNRVNDILQDIKKRGPEAVVEYAGKFDGYQPQSLQDIMVGQEELKKAFSYIQDNYPQLVKSIELCIKNIDYYHQQQLERESGSWFASPQKGKKMGQLVTPIEKVGIYVPGGRYPYPSSLIMAAVPAKLAEVNQIAVCSPQKKDHEAYQVFLYVCARLQIDQIYNLGGAQAIGLLAYGAGEISRVDKIVGPGNAYVTAAKKSVFGTVGIDSLAGPSEIVVIADDDANEDFIAADLISQAEHDPDAVSILLSNSRILAEKVIICLEKQMQSLRKSYEQNAHTAYNALKKHCFIAYDEDMEALVKASNLIAPEHLEIVCKNPAQVLKMVKNAGAVFVGNFTPVALGDYMGGTNHVIPTAGNARFSSPLGVYDFLKKSSVLFYDIEVLAQEKKYVQQFSAFENLHAHKRSIAIRFGDKKDED